ncbi:unnamed protein product, partial [Polarella glacialis]
GMFACCRRRTDEPQVADAEVVIDEIVGEQPDAGVLHVVLAEVLTWADVVLHASEQNQMMSFPLEVSVRAATVPQAALRVLAACGFRRGRNGQSLSCSSPAGIKVLLSAREAVAQLVRSLQEAGPGPVAPAAGSARGTAASPAPEGMASAAAAHGTSTEQKQEQQQLRQQQQQKQQQQQQQQQQEQEQRQRQQQEQQQEQQQQQEQEQEQRKPPQPPPKSSETPDAERCRGS